MPDLTGQDYQALASRWIDLPTASLANIQRLDHFTAKEHTGNSLKDLSGLWIPYFEPGNGDIWGGRIRRDHPEIKVKPDGSRKEDNKYINAPGFRHIYIPPTITKADLANTNLPVIICEGEFKALAALRLARYNSNTLRFVPVGIAGAYNWQGKIGKVEAIDGTQVDEKGLLPDFFLLEWVNRKTIMAFDRDPDKVVAWRVRGQRNQLRAHLMGLGASVGDLEWPITAVKKQTYGTEALRNGPQQITAKGLDDWLARDGPEVVLKAIEAIEYRDRSDWRAKLKTFPTTGMPKGLVLNALIALEQSPIWADAIVYDTFSQQLACDRRPWSEHKGPWESTDNVRLAAWLQEQGIEVSIDTARQAVRTAAKTVDPLEDYVKDLQWDGTPRIDRWLIDYMNVKTTNPEGEDITNYIAAVGTAWLVGGIARALEPGCQMDYVIVFCGKEGQGKSTAIDALANGWFTDSVLDVHGDEPMRKLQGIWVVEFGEIEAWRKAEAATLRTFITRKDDKYRALFEDNVRPHLRRCVFTATSNPTWFLDQDSENRRYWPVTCGGRVNVDLIKRDRHQLWAEAKARFEDGARPYIQDAGVDAMATLVREAFKKQEDPWTEPIVHYLRNNDQLEVFSVNDILRDAIKKDLGQLNNSTDQVRVANILKRLGYENIRYGKSRLSRWRVIPT